MACSQGANETILYLLHNDAIRDINAKTNVFHNIILFDLQDKKDALLLSIEGNCSANTVLELLVNGANIQTQTPVWFLIRCYLQDHRNVLMECAKYGRAKLFHIFYRFSNINVNVKDAVGSLFIHSLTYLLFDTRLLYETLKNLIHFL